MKSIFAGILIFLVTTTTLIASGDSMAIGKRDCLRLHKAMRNQIETIYLVQMAEFWAKRLRNSEVNIEIRDNITASLKEVSDALGHYDSADTRRAIDVILRFCPL